MQEIHVARRGSTLASRHSLLPSRVRIRRCEHGVIVVAIEQAGRGVRLQPGRPSCGGRRGHPDLPRASGSSRGDAAARPQLGRARTMHRVIRDGPGRPPGATYAIGTPCPPAGRSRPSGSRLAAPRRSATEIVYYAGPATADPAILTATTAFRGLRRRGGLAGRGVRDDPRPWRRSAGSLAEDRRASASECARARRSFLSDPGSFETSLRSPHPADPGCRRESVPRPTGVRPRGSHRVLDPHPRPCARSPSRA